MEEHNYHQAGLQHLAHLRQDLVQRQGASVLQHQAALVAVQDLERQRLQRQVLAEAGLEAHLQDLERCHQQQVK